MRRLALAVVLVLVPAAPAAATELVVVQSNVGNVNVPGCQAQSFKLCLTAVERRAAAALREIDPDVVGFQEVLPVGACGFSPSANPFNICSGVPAPASQVDRLLGDGYASVCDARFGWDCVVARRTRHLSLRDMVDTRPVQPGCEDRGFTLNIGRLTVDGWPVAIGVAHPSSSDAGCRAAQVADFFAALGDRGPALVLGDFNLDPYRESDVSVEEWRRHVPSRFRLVSGAELTSFPCGSSQLDPTGQQLDAPLEPCIGPLGPRSIDHVLARELTGSCEVRRVDGGGGMDHRAQVCRIAVPARVTPRPRLARRGCRISVSWRPAPRHLQAVRFTAGRRGSTDRRAPYTTRIPRGERVRVTAVPVTSIGAGRATRRTVRC